MPVTTSVLPASDRVPVAAGWSAVHLHAQLAQVVDRLRPKLAVQKVVDALGDDRADLVDRR